MRISDLQLWEAFVLVAQARSFAKAGRSLGIGAPNITKRISSLETQLGLRLFNRTTRSVTLTSEGEGLLLHARSLLESANELERRASDAGGLSGTIRLTCLPVVAFRWLAKEIEVFRNKFPDVEFELDLSERIVDLIGEQMDLAVRVHPPKGADFVYREIADNELVICASPAYLKKHSPIKTPQDLHQHSLLTLDLYKRCRFIKSGESLASFESSRKVKCEVGLFLTEMALLGEGVAIRSRWDVSPFLDAGTLVQCLPNDRLEPFGKAYLVIPQKRYLSARVRAFVDQLVANSGGLRRLARKPNRSRS